ncbi:MAG: hypothetical protein IJS44_04550, partial [Clostridia bacterium]|nr:hypothetical protein [Clostridia bacterium]
LTLTLNVAKTGETTTSAGTTVALEIDMTAVMESTKAGVTSTTTDNVTTFSNYITIEYNLGAGLSGVTATHKGNAMVNSTDTANDAGHGIYSYNAESGILTIKTKTLSPFAVSYVVVTPDTSWFNAEGDEFTLSSPAALAGFSKLVSEGNTFQGKTVKLDSDINLNNISWTPIGDFNGTNFTKAFRGTFDGQGHTVSNYTVDTHGGAGLFGEVYLGTIKNVTVKNVTVTANRMAGALVGQLYGDLENCHVINASVTGIPNEDGDSFDNGDKIGGLVGWIGDNGNNRHISDCSATNVTLRAYRDVGGLAGYIASSTSITDCTVENITITVDKLTNAYGNSSINAGYLYGRANGNNTVVDNTETGNNTTDIIPQ